MDTDDEAPLLTRQEQINAQDRGLDDLAAIIRRQREIGVMIGNEVEEQNGSFLVSCFSHALINT